VLEVSIGHHPSLKTHFARHIFESASMCLIESGQCCRPVILVIRRCEPQYKHSGWRRISLQAASLPRSSLPADILPQYKHSVGRDFRLGMGFASDGLFGKLGACAACVFQFTSLLSTLGAVRACAFAFSSCGLPSGCF
jgi:hypothetical protein